jgi:glycogen debranching enzyme
MSGEAPKQRLLTQDEPSHATGIGDASVIKDAGLYFLCRPDGSVPLEEGHGLGLYFRDCRFLSGYEFRVANVPLETLAANDEDGFRAIFQLTNPKIERGDQDIGRQRIGARWRHVIDAQNQALRDELTLENYDTKPHSFPLSLSFAADFRDVFVIRGLVEKRPGTLRSPRWEAGALVFSYEGGDQVVRELRIEFSEPPSQTREAEAIFELELGPHQVRSLGISLAIVETQTPGRADRPQVAAAAEGMSGVEKAFERSIDGWMKGFTRVRSTSLWAERAVDRSLRDLRALRMTIDEHRFFAAGVPWFTTLFGRDSIICALQTLAYRPEIAAETLRLLARFQGKSTDSWRDEEPGKILHELRVGELARMGAIPHTPYYGTVDATPLFLVLLGEYVRWKGELSLFEELRGPVEAALRWIDEFGDHDRDGYLDYQAKGGEQLINQGWKDSGGAIVDSSGRRAEAPIALCEVQGYAYRAKEEMAELFERAGDAKRAGKLRRDAAALRERFNRDFWLEEKGFYALALERGGRRVDAITSNVGQALWTGIIDDQRVPTVVDRLMADDMYSGWGIRTLSSGEGAYNPVGYHLGTVWPHDNALIAAGLRRHGHDAEACRIFSNLVDASTYFSDNRLPEAFAGYSRAEYGVPVRYPVACHPQAWASGSIPFLLIVLLGLEPNAFDRRLRVIRPSLPPFVDRIELENLRVGAAQVDLLFDRAPSGELTVRVKRLEGDLEVQVEPAS